LRRPVHRRKGQADAQHGADRPGAAQGQIDQQTAEYRGHDAIGEHQPAGRPTAGSGRRQLHHPLNRQQEAQEEGEAQGALDREGQQADASHR
jgi:hypothetical protein